MEVKDEGRYFGQYVKRRCILFCFDLMLVVGEFVVTCKGKIGLKSSWEIGDNAL